MSKGKEKGKIIISLIKRKGNVGVRKTDTNPKAEKVPKDQIGNELIDDQPQENPEVDENSTDETLLNEGPIQKNNWQEDEPLGPTLVTVTRVIKQLPGFEPW